ncbi:AroM family protein [Paraburkholderia unamae]|uniref:Protein AroM n=1 Tax=Paraburkholderia unamae TaxID=219649 RepID=A0ABX5KIW8_9BURK|nr:AroM family protein [Paraburkholderia unamae]PVX76978.1 protein AroM [Paraburkholderia unamae]CAG9260264.1 Protein AroM [Paraburkholderia unamae]
MTTRKLGTLTIGQAPRADITPILDAHLPAALPRVHMGVLDGLTREAIETRYAPQPGNATLVSRLLDGSSVVIDKPAVRAVLQEKIDALAAQGCDVVLVLCTGEFHGLEGRAAWLIEPDRIVPPAAAALAGERQVGIVVPLASQIDSEFRKWAGLHRAPICAAASPYRNADETGELIAAARQLRDEGADLLILDCMGFVERHRQIVQEASGLPVILSNALIARLTAEVLQ